MGGYADIPGYRQPISFCIFEPMTKNSRSSDVVFLLALVFSGAAALGYELLWTRLLALSLGGEVLGILGVLAGFFGGMVLGAFVLSEHASRVRKPLRFFIILELCTAPYGLVSPWLIYGLSRFLPQWLGPAAGDNNSFVALLLTVLVAGLALLPATFCIGANFAYLVEARRRSFRKQQRAKNLGRVYAANTLGATLGVFAAVYWVMPGLGLAWSGAFFAAVGIMAVLLAIWWQRSWGNPGDKKKSGEKVTKKAVKTPYFTYGLLFGTGLAAIGLEIVVVHLLKQILQNTVFTFANILAVYLLGTAIGAWLYQYFYQKKDRQRVTPLLFSGMLFSVALLALSLNGADVILNAFSPSSVNYGGHLRAEVLLAFILFLVPTLFMGALFSHLMSWVRPALVGKAYAVNTLGSMLSPFVFGLLLIPNLGSAVTLVVVSALYLLLLAISSFKLNWHKKWLVAGLVPFALVAVLSNSGLDLITIKDGMQELERQEGLMGTVLVTEEPKREGPYGLPLRTLQVNNHFRMGGGVSFLERRMGNLPLLLADNPKKVLFLGVGTGTTLGVIQNYAVEQVDAVEIVPEMEQLLPWFKEHNQDVLSDARLQYHTADARRFVVASRDTYDLIIADLFHPARDGAGLLYTKEHFEHLHDHLTTDGVMAQWIPLHQFDLPSLKMVIRTFQTVFPETHAFLGGYNAQFPVIVLVGTPASWRIKPLAIHNEIASSINIQMAFENGQDLLGSYLAGPRELSQFAGNGPLNTDLNPRILFQAPRSVYTTELERAQTNIAALLDFRSPMPVDILEQTNNQQDFLNSVLQNWQAIGHFLEGNQQLVSGNDPMALQKYADAYRANPDFSPARGKLFQAVIEGAIPAQNLQQLLIPRDMERLQLILDGR